MFLLLLLENVYVCLSEISNMLCEVTEIPAEISISLFLQMSFWDDSSEQAGAENRDDIDTLFCSWKMQCPGFYLARTLEMTPQLLIVNVKPGVSWSEKARTFVGRHSNA